MSRLRPKQGHAPIRPSHFLSHLGQPIAHVSHDVSNSVLAIHAAVFAQGANVRNGWKADVAADSFESMSSHPPVKLSVLRDIAWRHWDPIGLNGADGGWQRNEAADEYDRYALRVAGGLQNGQSDEALIDYLVRIETQHMGLTMTPAATERAAATVTAIREYIESLS